MGRQNLFHRDTEPLGDALDIVPFLDMVEAKVWQAEGGFRSRGAHLWRAGFLC